jgi:hypothetical protein
MFGAVLVMAVLGSGAALDRLAREQPLSPHAATSSTQHVQRALAAARASWEVRQLAQWVVQTQDHGLAPFVVVDKAQARIYAFAADGDLLASSDVLLGALRSDDAQAAATPAGRFTAQDRGGSVARLVWASPEAELELFGTRTHQTPGRSAWRLASDRTDDKRISDGSLHVAPEFFREHLARLRGHPSILYVLPETAPSLRVADGQRIAPIRRPS